MPALKRHARRMGLRRPDGYKPEPMPRMRWYSWRWPTWVTGAQRQPLAA